MVFSSTIFLLYFFPLFLGVYYLANRKYKNYIVLIFSLIFYAWGAPKFIFILLASTYINYMVVRKMNAELRQNLRHLYFIASILINVGLLAYFKYANFFVENISVLLSTLEFQEINWTKVALPVGISFFTFQSITYTVDTYRRVSKPLKTYSNYLLYILMFPQLIAGPIVRYNTIAEQIKNRTSTYNDRILGFYRFIIGLSKKVLIANVLAETADEIMQYDFAYIDSTTAWLGILAYTFQIYFDFSGYSDMAIGIGRMIGFKFPENFNNPYVSKNITEFWRRWHITLGAWMRDYLYIPLGGNRVKSKWRLYFNLWVVFLISGLWHGASWNFVIWGAFHGFFLIIDRLFFIKLSKKIGGIISTIFTFFIVVMSWVIFRIENFDDAIQYYNRLFEFNFGINKYLYETKFLFILIIAFLFSFIIKLPLGKKLHNIVFANDYSVKLKIIFFLISVILFILVISNIITGSFNPFIYYRF